MVGDVLPSMQGRAYTDAQKLQFVLRIKESVDAGLTITAAINELITDQLTVAALSTGKKTRLTDVGRTSKIETMRRRYDESHKEFLLQSDWHAMIIDAARELGHPASIIEAIDPPREVDGYRNPIDYRVKPQRGRPRKSA